MWKWAPYPFVRITLSFIAGILLYVTWGKELGHSAWFLAFFVCTFPVAALLSQRLKSSAVTNLAGLLGVLCFVTGGMAVTHARTAANQAQNILHLPVAPAYYVGVVSDYVVQKPGYQSTVLQLAQVQVHGQWQQATGRVQLSVPHDSDKAYELAYGDRLLVKGSPQLVPPPANPQQFDYRAFLENKNILHRHSLQSHHYQKLGSAPPNMLLHYSIGLRRQLERRLRAGVDQPREYGISSALVLGVKDELDNAIRTAYAQTGTMHVLAVSGLHVGLLYLVLMLFLKHLNAGRLSRTVSAVVILAVLWGYAFMTGLSPSVLRAVLMFSLVTVAMALQRQTNIYNTLAVAAFALLFLNPYYLFEVSFQLSFLAVLGIVYLQPRLYGLLKTEKWQPNSTWTNRLFDKIWALLTVSVAAQVATLPLGLYYFHQFPVYFWIANLPIIPLAMLALYSGMAALLFSWVPGLGWLLFQLHTGAIWCMNEANLLLTGLPKAVLDGISVSKAQAFMLYALLLLFILFFYYKKLRYLALATFLVGVLGVQQIQKTLAQGRQKALTVYSLRGGTALSFVDGKEAVFVADSVTHSAPETFGYNIQPHLWHLGIKAPQRYVLHTVPTGQNVQQALLPDGNSLYAWQGKRLLLLEKPLNVQASVPLEVDYVLVTRNARIKAEELQQQFTFKLLLLDASNSPWYLQQLREKLTALEIPFHDIAASGAFVLETTE